MAPMTTRKKKHKTLNTYTLVLDYGGGTYISQVQSNSGHSAFTQWIKKELDLNILKVKKTTAEEVLRKVRDMQETPTPIRGLVNVWCAALLLDDKLGIVHIVKTRKT